MRPLTIQEAALLVQVFRVAAYGQVFEVRGHGSGAQITGLISRGLAVKLPRDPEASTRVRDGYRLTEQGVLLAGSLASQQPGERSVENLSAGVDRGVHGAV